MDSVPVGEVSLRIKSPARAWVRLTVTSACSTFKGVLVTVSVLETPVALLSGIARLSVPDAAGVASEYSLV